MRWPRAVGLGEWWNRSSVSGHLSFGPRFMARTSQSHILKPDPENPLRRLPLGGGPTKKYQPYLYKVLGEWKHMYQTQTVFPYLRHVFNGNTSIFIKIFCFHTCGRLFSTSRILIMIGPQPAIFVFLWSQYFKVSVSRWMNAHVSHTNSVFPYLRHVFNGNASMFIKNMLFPCLWKAF